MIRKIFSVIGSVILALIALVLFAHGNYLFGLLLLFAAGQSIYKNFFVAPTPPKPPTNVTSFEDIKNAVAQRGAVGLFVGKIPELQTSATYGVFAAEIEQVQSQMMNAVGGRGVATGNPLIDIGLNMGMKAGVSKLVANSTDVLVVRFSDGTHLSTTLTNGVTKAIANFLATSQAAGIPVEGVIKKSPIIAGPFLLVLAIVVTLAVVFFMFAYGT